MSSNILKNIAGAISAIMYMVWSLGGTAIHLWTVLLAYNVKGFFAALVTFILPVLSAIYWAIYFWDSLHTFWNTYTMAVAGFGVISLLGLGLMAVVDRD